MMPEHLVNFSGTTFPSLSLVECTELSIALTAANSPVLFGCRSGICGTCLVEVETNGGTIPPPGNDEAEALSIYAPGNPKARLACQIQLTANLSLKKIVPE